MNPRCLFAILLTIILLCSCSGGAGSPGPGPIPPGPTPSPTPTATPTPTGNAGGVVSIPVPTPAPVICSPSPVTVSVSQIANVACSAAGYGGAFTFIVGDPTIASVKQIGSSPFFYVTGLKLGTTTMTVLYPPGGMGSVAINVL